MVVIVIIIVASTINNGDDDYTNNNIDFAPSGANLLLLLLIQLSVCLASFSELRIFPMSFADCGESVVRDDLGQAKSLLLASPFNFVLPPPPLVFAITKHVRPKLINIHRLFPASKQSIESG